jgi:hypothetical protein
MVRNYANKTNPVLQSLHKKILHRNRHYIHVNTNFQMYLLLVCCKRRLPQPQLQRLVGLFTFKFPTLTSSDVVEHMCHKVLVNCCLVVPATVFPGSNACFSGLVIFLNDENLTAAFIIPFIFSQMSNRLLRTTTAIKLLPFNRASLL